MRRRRTLPPPQHRLTLSLSQHLPLLVLHGPPNERSTRRLQLGSLWRMKRVCVCVGGGTERPPGWQVTHKTHQTLYTQSELGSGKNLGFLVTQHMEFCSFWLLIPASALEAKSSLLLFFLSLSLSFFPYFGKRLWIIVNGCLGWASSRSQ